MNEEPKIGCVNHDCDKCKAVQEPVAQALSRDAVLANIAGWLRHLADDVTIPYFTNGAFKADCNEAADVLLTPPKAQPAPVQEPVAQSLKDAVFTVIEGFNIPHDVRKILESAYYNAPPAAQPAPVKTYHDGKPWPVAPKPWVWLTKDDVESWDLPVDPTVFEFVQFIEAKLKEKNHDQ
jgi:hypothetical protein